MPIIASSKAAPAKALSRSIGVRRGATEVASTSFIVRTLNTGAPLSSDRISFRTAGLVLAGSPLVRITNDMLDQLASCAYGTYICWLGSLSSDRLVSPTTPTISRGNFSSRQIVRCFPMGLWPGHSRRAIVSLTMTTLGVLSVSRNDGARSEEHTSELQSLAYLVCRLLLEKKNKSLRSQS